MAIEDRDFPLPASDHAGLLHLPCDVRNGRSLDPQHFGEQALRNQERVLVTPIMHHKETGVGEGVL